MPIEPITLGIVSSLVCPKPPLIAGPISNSIKPNSHPHPSIYMTKFIACFMRRSYRRVQATCAALSARSPGTPGWAKNRGLFPIIFLQFLVAAIQNWTSGTETSSSHLLKLIITDSYRL
jgi:hypothetical protein